MADPNCLFCKIVRGDIPAAKVFDDGVVTAFRDINPRAPVHLLVIPNEHLESTSALEPRHDVLVGRLVRTAADLAGAESLAERGYRLVTNCGPEAGQSVQHLHFHLLGGRPLGWPPG